MSESDENSFIAQYLKYTKKQESPEAFHLWTSITLLSGVLGRKCFLHKGFYTLYPNLFVILVAGSARCRKSTAINIGIDLLDGLETPKIISGKITPERFIIELEQSPKVDSAGVTTHLSPNILVHSSELSVFLTKQSYGEPLIHILTDLFDCPNKWSYKTKNSNETNLKDVFLSILAATTPTGVAQGIPIAALHEGFASRVLFCFQGDTPRRNPFPELTEEEVALQGRLRRMLRERSQLAGQFQLDAQAKEWYRGWYDYHMAENPDDSRLDGVHGRKHDQVLRLGIILAGDRMRKVICDADLDAALLAIENLEKEVSGAFREIGSDDTTPFMNRMRSFMHKHKVVSHSMLLRALYPLSATVFKTIVETAVESGWLKRAPDNYGLYLWAGDKKEVAE